MVFSEISFAGTSITNKTLKLMSEKMKGLKKIEFECTGHKSFDELAILPNLQVLVFKALTRLGDDALDKLVHIESILLFIFFRY